ncbi:MAG: hypothetical protein ACO2ZZ_07380 [Cyclobacteriaceae bacterium]
MKKKSASHYYQRWLIQSPVALLLIGFGVCLVSEAAMIKASGAETWSWFSSGTIALIVLNTGISLFGDAVLHRVRYERMREKCD